MEAEIHVGIDPTHSWIVLDNDFRIQFYKPSSNKPWPSQGRTSALCFKLPPSNNPLEEIVLFRNQLFSMGATTVEPPIQKSFGVEVWMTDPEGNDFLILAPNEKHRNL